MRALHLKTQSIQVFGYSVCVIEMHMQFQWQNYFNHLFLILRYFMKLSTKNSQQFEHRQVFLVHCRVTRKQGQSVKKCAFLNEMLSHSRGF